LNANNVSVVLSLVRSEGNQEGVRFGRENTDIFGLPLSEATILFPLAELPLIVDGCCQILTADFCVWLPRELVNATKKFRLHAVPFVPLLCVPHARLSFHPREATENVGMSSISIKMLE
jgi:hypothetical protein